MTVQPLTQDQIILLLDAIRDRFIHVCLQLGENHYEVPDELLQRWKDEKLIHASAKKEDFAVPGILDGVPIVDFFVFGRFQMALEQGRCFEEAMRKALHQPLLKPDKYAVSIVESQLAEYKARGGHLSPAAAKVNEMTIAYHAGKLRATDAYGQDTDTIVDDWRGLASELGRAFQDYSIDWEKIAYCKDANVRGRSVLLGIMENYGSEQLVYKMPLPTACQRCKFLYLEPDGETPRLFKASELLAWGTNSGRKRMPMKGGKVVSTERPDGAETWKPVAGVIHPWCQCYTPHLFTGYEPWAKRVLQSQEICDENVDAGHLSDKK